jgi:hypothetical protein
MTFGKNPFDLVPDKVGRYHVVDAKGFIRAKHKHGFGAYDNAFRFSDSEPGVKFTALDTRDGSEYGSYLDGVDVSRDS